MAGFKLGFFGDQGNQRNSGTRFPYDLPAEAPGAVAKLIRNGSAFRGVTDVVGLGDLTYDGGASTSFDPNIGQFFNNYIFPYPSPRFLSGDYLRVGSSKARTGERNWPFNVFNYPFGYPNPLDGGVGGSRDRMNHFWPTPGNHDYGLRIGYPETNVAKNVPAPKDSTIQLAEPVGPSSTAVPLPYLDYFPWQKDLSLLANQANVKIGSADGTGNQGFYYSVTFGRQDNGAPLIELFSLDTQRLQMNSYDYNRLTDGFGYPVSAPIGTDNILYDPTIPYNPANPNSVAQRSTDPANGQKQYNWLVDGLRRSKAKWKFLVGHQPIYTSGRIDQEQPDDHLSNPVLQNILRRAVQESGVGFDAWLNGHSHYYQRVLEGNALGIGAGVPFITLGNSGRDLYTTRDVLYGQSIYESGALGTPEEKAKEIESYNKGAIVNGRNLLLQSDPLNAAYSALLAKRYGQPEGVYPGRYGDGFGAMSLEAEDQFLLFRYQQTDVLDPAIIEQLDPLTRSRGLIGWDGLVVADWVPSTPADTAQLDITIEPNGALSKVAIREGRAGRGYMASKGGSHVVDFQIRGNDAIGLGSADNPNGYAIVRLKFSNGLLAAATLLDPGQGFQLAAQASPASPGGSFAVTSKLVEPVVQTLFLNHSLYEGRYEVPYRDYQDWYLASDTQLQASATAERPLGSLALNLRPSSARAREIIASMAVTTGYSGAGAQATYPYPLKGDLSLSDALGHRVGGARKQSIRSGVANLMLERLPAPGPLQLQFGGDPFSSYLVNYRPASSVLNLSYGSWRAGITAGFQNTLQLADQLPLAVTRTDSTPGRASFGLRPTGRRASGRAHPNVNAFARVLVDALPASASALSTNRLFSPAGPGGWTGSIGQAIGSSAAAPDGLVGGSWRPVAIDSKGIEHAATAISVSSNTAAVAFANGLSARFSFGGTGTAVSRPSTGAPMLRLQRGSAGAHGLALYEADPITGVISGPFGQRLAPGQPGYLQAALASARRSGLVVGPERLPAVSAEALITDLPLNAARNYGVLLLRNGDPGDLLSSFATANAARQVASQSFVAPERGVIFAFEDQPNNPATADFTDLIVTLSNSTFSLS